MKKKIIALSLIIIGTISISLIYFKKVKNTSPTQVSSATPVSNKTQVAAPISKSNTRKNSEKQSDQPPAVNRETSSSNVNQNGSTASTSSTNEPNTVTGAAATQTTSQPGHPSCYRLLFNHAPIDSHQDGEACLHHKNQITLSHEQINRASVCVRVNGTPTAHKLNVGKPISVTIGAVAGPHAEISVQYCTGKMICNDPCKVPKDEFLSAIGGEESESAGGSWDSESGPNADEKALQGELKNLNQETKGDSEQISLFKGWNKKSETESCQGNQKLKR